ncbi:MAG TPA: amidohydrolase family protein [Pirellulaceae bacterium]|nr:amidohydrolase family protein [Pirellulaceae bacterium]
MALNLACVGRAEGLKEINPPKEPDSNETTALVGARLIDGRGGPPIENAVVVVRGSKLIAVGRRGSTAIPRDAKQIDASGMSLLPGLIDSHFHSVNDLKSPVELLLKRGVTTFRDPGHPFRFYQAVMQTDTPMPRVFLCGAHLDAYPPVWAQQAVIVKDADHAGRAVHQHVDRGASAIKIYFRLPLEYFPAVCQAAKQRGVLVTAHLELVDDDDAIRAGVRGIEHTSSFGTTLAESEQAEQFRSVVAADPNARKELRYRMWAALDLDSSPRVKPLLDLIVKHNVFVSPTLSVYERRAGEKGATVVQEQGFANMMRFAGMCHAAGAKVVVGSHTWGPFVKQGWPYQRELELLVDSGLTPLEAITADTLDNAQFFGAEDRLGSIEPGKSADLLLVAGNPAKDIRAMYNVRHVMLNGVWMRTPPNESTTKNK